MIAYLADRKYNILSMMSTELDTPLKIIDDSYVSDVESGVETANILCEITSHDKDSYRKAKAYTEAGNYIFMEIDGESRYFIIIDRDIDRKNNEIELYLESSSMDLLNEITGSYEADEPHEIAYYMNKWLYDTGFEIKLNEIGNDPKQKIKWSSSETNLSRIQSTAKSFDAEIDFTFKIDGMRVTKKYLNIYKKRGNYNGVNLHLNKEVRNITIKDSIKDIVTCIYPQGGVPEESEDNINISGMQYDDGDIYIDGQSLKSRKGLTRWSRYATETGNDVGHIVGEFRSDTVDKNTLLYESVKYLKQHSTIQTNYEIDLVENVKNVNVGDYINIIDVDGDLFLSSRILKIERSVIKDKNVLTLGDYLPLSNDVEKQIQQMANDFAAQVKNKKLYTWVVYADTFDGKGISLNPYGKAYMGTAPNRIKEEVDISDPTIFKWVKVLGDNGKDGAKGEPGDKGEPGVGIKSNVVKYYMSTSKTTQTGGEWLDKCPEWKAKHFLWVKHIITYTDGTVKELSPMVDTSWQAVDLLKINSRNLLLNTKNEYTVTGKNIANQAQGLYSFVNVKMVANKHLRLRYTLTFDKFKGRISLQLAGEPWTGVYDSVNIKEETTDTIVYDTFIDIPSSILSTNTSAIQYLLDNATGNVTFKNFMLVDADKHVDWVMASEDVVKEVKNITTKFEKTDESIQGLVDATTITTAGGQTIGLKEDHVKLREDVSGLHSSVETVNQKYDNMRIGSRNLFRYSEVNATNKSKWKPVGCSLNVETSTALNGVQVYTIDTTSADGTHGLDGSLNPTCVIGGHTYTWSYYMWTSYAFTPDSGTGLHMQVYDPEGKNYYWEKDMIYHGKVDGSHYCRIGVTFTVPTEHKYYYFRPYIYYLKKSSRYCVYGFQLEEGNVMTSYVKAQEDFDSEIKTANENITKLNTKIDQTNTAVSLRATKTELQNAKTELNGTITSVNKKVEENSAALVVANNAIETKVSKETFNNLKTGGRNLWTGTRHYTGSNWINLSAWSKESGKIDGFTVMKRKGNWDGLTQRLYVVQGEEYVYSAYVKWDTGTCNVTVGVGADSSNTAEFMVGETSYGPINQYSYRRVSRSFKVYKSGYIKVGFEASTAETTAYVYAIKMERGNRPTDWTPAPEDGEGDVESIRSTLHSVETKITDEKLSVTINKMKNRLIKFRYIRDVLGGSTMSQNSHWTEIQVWDNLGNNLAKGKTPTFSSALSLGSASMVTDGTIASDKYAQITGNGWCRIDLGAVHENVSEIKIWRFFGDTRQYNARVEVSVDGTNWLALYDTNVNGKYTETRYGHTIRLNSNAVNTTNITMSDAGLDVRNGGISIHNNSAHKVFYVDSKGNLVHEGLFIQKDHEHGNTSVDIKGNNIRFYDYTKPDIAVDDCSRDLGMISANPRPGDDLNRAFMFVGSKSGHELRIGTYGSTAWDTMVPYMIMTDNEHAVAPIRFKKSSVMQYGTSLSFGTPEDDSKILGKICSTSSCDLYIGSNYDYRQGTVKIGSYHNGNWEEYLNVNSTGVLVRRDFNVTGTKNRIVKSEKYKCYIAMSAYETTECYFGDLQKYKIPESGTLKIVFDDKFLETVNTALPYHVNVFKPYGTEDMTIEELKNLTACCVKMEPDYCVIKGTPNCTFSCEIKAKQRGYEDDRMREIKNI